jgi:hypothetical protein
MIFLFSFVAQLARVRCYVTRQAEEGKLERLGKAESLQCDLTVSPSFSSTIISCISCPLFKFAELPIRFITHLIAHRNIRERDFYFIFTS